MNRFVLSAALGIFFAMSGLFAESSEPARKPDIELTGAVVEVPDAAFLSHEKELEEAVRAGDRTRLAAFAKDGLKWIALPEVSTRTGDRAVLQRTREYRYPTSIRRDADGNWEPDAFETADLGVALDLTPEWTDGAIRVQGKWTFRFLDQMVPGEEGISTPAFQTTEAYFFHEMGEGTITGFWLPGARTLRSPDGKGIPSLLEMNPEKLAATPDSEWKAARLKLGIILSARKITPPPRLPANARLEVAAFNVTGTRLADEAVSRVRKWQGAADPGSRVLAFVDDKDSVPEGAAKISVSEPKAGEFEFEIAEGWRGTVTWRAASNSLEIGFSAPAGDGRSIRTNVAPSMLVTGPCRALLVRADGGEAVLVLVRKKE